MIRVMTAHPHVADDASMATPPISTPALAWPVALLVDEMLGCYVDWREEATAVSDAYRRWSNAPEDEKVCRFTPYIAALDLEETADD
jgi:hypothetical protein